MSDQIACYILCGGVGSRLWPLSREDNPKQFHALAGDGTMLAKTLRRIGARREGRSHVAVIAAERHADRIRGELATQDRPVASIFEPQGRNTAAAVAVATMHALDRHGDVLLLVVPSDAEIVSDEGFWQTIHKGEPAAREGRIVVFGIRPTHPETGYGYIEVEAGSGDVVDVSRFVEKPDIETAAQYVASGRFYWNAGIFLFRASAMRDAFERLRPDIWSAAKRAYDEGGDDRNELRLAAASYGQVPAISIDYAIMEKVGGIAMVPASFSWSDLGSWESLMSANAADRDGNVLIGDALAVECRGSYLRGDGRLVAAVGLEDIAVVATPDAVFVTPLKQSQKVKAIFEELEKAGRRETRFTMEPGGSYPAGAWAERMRRWLLREALPLWSTTGIDRRGGGFHEALSLAGEPTGKPKRTRTMARQIYAFAAAKALDWGGPADELVAYGIDFLTGTCRTASGGFVRSVDMDGQIVDPAEDLYDHACILLALAHAHRAGHARARALADETLAFLDRHLADSAHGGFFETSARPAERRSNPHMHFLEAMLAWFETTGERDYLKRAARIVELFATRFFDAQTWSLGEYFDESWNPSAGPKGRIVEPGHHFEWAALLCDFADKAGTDAPRDFARKLYGSALAGGINRKTGLAYGAVSRSGEIVEPVSRSWAQTEGIKAAIALDGRGGPPLGPEIEARIATLFRAHIDPAPKGLWIDRIDENGRACGTEVPASILYHIVFAFSQYLRR